MEAAQYQLLALTLISGDERGAGLWAVAMVIMKHALSPAPAAACRTSP